MTEGCFHVSIGRGMREVAISVASLLEVAVKQQGVREVAV